MSDKEINIESHGDEMSEPRARVPRPNDQASDVGYNSEKIH